VSGLCNHQIVIERVGISERDDDGLAGGDAKLGLIVAHFAGNRLDRYDRDQIVETVFQGFSLLFRQSRRQ